MMSGIEGVTAFPADEADITKWVGSITGQSGTVYEGLEYKLKINFGESYPMSAPTISLCVGRQRGEVTHAANRTRCCIRTSTSRRARFASTSCAARSLLER